MQSSFRNKEFQHAEEDGYMTNAAKNAGQPFCHSTKCLLCGDSSHPAIEVVKRISLEYLQGSSCQKITKGLEHDGVRGMMTWPKKFCVCVNFKHKRQWTIQRKRNTKNELRNCALSFSHSQVKSPSLTRPLLRNCLKKWLYTRTIWSFNSSQVWLSAWKSEYKNGFYCQTGSRNKLTFALWGEFLFYDSNASNSLHSATKSSYTVIVCK